MDLRSGQAFWPLKNGPLSRYPKLGRSLQSDVLILGAGITGALLADALSEMGASVAVLDKRGAALGSTSASTALLQYEIDVHLADLIERIGEGDAVRAYRLCREAIGKLERLTERLDDGFSDHCGFSRKTSLYFASSEADVAALEREYEARRRAGFRLELWDRTQVEARYSFSAPAALYSLEAAQLDPYRLTHRLLERAAARGACIFERTEARRVEASRRGVVVTTAEGRRIAARYLVFATGYESQGYLREKVVDLNSTYALASEPLPTFEGWFARSLLWETARPYLYLRTTEDGRAIVGGEDMPFQNDEARDALLGHKRRRLEERFRELFPKVPFETAYAWTGTFGGTKDGLAYIGQSPEFPSSFFALGYGGNGVTYSVVAADIIRDLILGRDNPDQHIFRFGR